MHDDNDNDDDFWFWTSVALIFSVSERHAPLPRGTTPLWRMKLWITILLIGAGVVTCRDSRASESNTLEGRVVGVADGDTLTLLVGREQHRVRLAGIDAPERGQAFGERAKQALSELCFGDIEARVSIEDRDRFGRIVGRVLCRGQNANAALVEQGYAWVYTRYNRDQALPPLQAAAKANRRGLWADPGAIPPWDWRRNRT